MLFVVSIVENALFYVEIFYKYETNQARTAHLRSVPEVWRVSSCLFHFPRVVGQQQFLEVVVILLGAHFFNLRMNGLVVSGLVHVADYA